MPDTSFDHWRCAVSLANPRPLSLGRPACAWTPMSDAAAQACQPWTGHKHRKLHSAAAIEPDTLTRGMLSQTRRRKCLGAPGQVAPCPATWRTPMQGSVQLYWLCCLPSAKVLEARVFALTVIVK